MDAPMTYAEVHFRYTAPAVCALALVARPFVDRSELFKMALVCALALAYTAPWSHAVVWHGARTYPRDRAALVVEHAATVARAALAALWTLLCVRWSVPCARFNHDARSHALVRWTPIACFAAAAAAGLAMAATGRRTFYLGTVLAWAGPALAFAWYGAGNYAARRPWPVCAAVLGPAAFLCCVHQLALRDGAWTVDPLYSLGAFAADSMPLEEVLFSFVSTAIVVLAAVSYDKARAVADAHAHRFPGRFRVRWPFVKQLFRAFAAAECSLPADVARDADACVRVLIAASKSFTSASFLFPSGGYKGVRRLVGFVGFETAF